MTELENPAAGAITLLVALVAALAIVAVRGGPRSTAAFEVLKIMFGSRREP